MSGLTGYVVSSAGSRPERAACGYCGTVIEEPPAGAILGHMVSDHGRELPLAVYRDPAGEGYEGLWTALACHPDERAWE